jgi:hypothetical protein
MSHMPSHHILSYLVATRGSYISFLYQKNVSQVGFEPEHVHSFQMRPTNAATCNFGLISTKQYKHAINSPTFQNTNIKPSYGSNQKNKNQIHFKIQQSLHKCVTHSLQLLTIQILPPKVTQPHLIRLIKKSLIIFILKS